MAKKYKKYNPNPSKNTHNINKANDLELAQAFWIRCQGWAEVIKAVRPVVCLIVRLIGLIVAALCGVNIIL